MATDSQHESVQGAAGSSVRQPVQPGGDKPSQPETAAALSRESRLVKQWTGKVKDAKKKSEADFKRMREDIKFARGLQWTGQQHLDDARYVCNLVLRSLNQGVAQLYARNPECEAIRRDRLDFELWDGRMESLQEAQMAFMASAQSGMEPPPLAKALLEDYSKGEMWRDIVERVGKSVRFVMQYMMDTQQPSFKLQMKQLVRRVKTTGVGYVKINYDDGFEQSLSTSETESTIIDRAKRIKLIADKLEKGEINEESPELATLALLGNSIHSSMQNGDTQNINQRITFDFLPSTSVIVDPKCRFLKGFVGARWMAVEYIYDLDYINAYFEAKIKGDEIKQYNDSGQELADFKSADGQSDAPKKTCCCWEIFDLDSKSTFYIVDGYDKFVAPPSAVMPEVNHFWPIVALTFNDVESDSSAGSECSIYPPSDVQLMRAPQKEWNRSREALRKHRIANTPCYLTGKGWLTDNDKEKIINHEDSAVIELEGAQIGTEIGKLLAPFAHSPIQPQLYDSTPLNQDIQFSTGEQDANLGRPSPKVTATGATIAEQSRASVASSNVDDLDDLLSALVQMGGEIILRYFRIDTVKRIAGRGAILPQQDREDFLNEIVLSVKAASSGRPNKAVNSANFQQIAPLLIQAGANPVGIVEEGVKVLDDRLDISKFFPVVPQGQMIAQAATQPERVVNGDQQPAAQPQQQMLPNQSPALNTTGQSKQNS